MKNKKCKRRIRIKFIRKFKVIKNNIRNIRPKTIMNCIMKKPRRFVQRFKNSDNKFRFVLNSILESRAIIILLILLLWVKTTFFYNNTISNAGLNKFALVNMDGDYQYNPEPQIMEKISLFDYTSIMTLIVIAILTLPLFFIKKSKNRFRRNYDI